MLRFLLNQIDASVSGGNSGGPIIDNNADVIGILTYSLSGDEAADFNAGVSADELTKLLSENGITTQSSNYVLLIEEGINNIANDYYKWAIDNFHEAIDIYPKSESSLNPFIQLAQEKIDNGKDNTPIFSFTLPVVGDLFIHTQELIYIGIAGGVFGLGLLILIIVVISKVTKKKRPKDESPAEPPPLEDLPPTPAPQPAPPPAAEQPVPPIETAPIAEPVQSAEAMSPVAAESIPDVTQPQEPQPIEQTPPVAQPEKPTTIPEPIQTDTLAQPIPGKTPVPDAQPVTTGNESLTQPIPQQPDEQQSVDLGSNITPPTTTNEVSPPKTSIPEPVPPVNKEPTQTTPSAPQPPSSDLNQSPENSALDDTPKIGTQELKPDSPQTPSTNL